MTTKICDAIKNVVPYSPKIGIVLGSGLGEIAENIENKYIIDYKDLDGFPISTVDGHKGRFVFGIIDSVPVVLMQGRVHYYEGYSMNEVVLPIRVMKMLGVETLIITNASGGINFDFKVGDIMLITDHISNFIPNPLLGPNDNNFGPRFPSMDSLYEKRLNAMVLEAANELDLKVHQGTYVQLTGPSLETPAEIKMLRILGADAVGMSSVCEAIVAQHMGMHICGISCITNLATGMSDLSPSFEDISKASKCIQGKISKLLVNIVKQLKPML